MLRIATCTFIIALLSACSAHSQNLAEGRVSINGSGKLDGVYEFVSESTVLTEPRKAAYQRSSPEWTGIWQFQNGYYTRILMKGRRDTFFDSKGFEDLGFESFAGPYEVEGGSVRLIQKYAIHPFAVDRSALMKYQINGETLTLTETLHPYLEDPREGTVTTVLRRVK